MARLWLKVAGAAVATFAAIKLGYFVCGLMVLTIGGVLWLFRNRGK